MSAVALSLAYVGVALCYQASPKTPGAAPITRSSRVARLVGLGVLGAALVFFAASMHSAEGVLVGLSAVMLAASVLVIAAPLVPRFVPVTAALALVLAAVVGWW